MSAENCIFCKIVKKEIPSDIIYESESILAFMDIGPLSEGHFLVIPKEHAEKMHLVSDETLSEILVVMKKLVKASGVENYNILQNNGKIAHQAVFHTHFHMIPRPNSNEGLSLKWNPNSNYDQKSFAEKIKANL